MKKALYIFLLLGHNTHSTERQTNQFMHPLTGDQLESLIENNRLDLTRYKDIFCAHSCCVKNFVELRKKHKNLILECRFSKNDKETLERNIARYHGNKYKMAISTERLTENQISQLRSSSDT